MTISSSMLAFSLSAIMAFSASTPPSEAPEAVVQDERVEVAPAAPNEGPLEPEPEKPVDAPEPEKKLEPEKTQKDYDVDVDARVVAGGRMQHEEAAVDESGAVVGTPVRKGSLNLRQARIGVDARYKDLLRARLSIDLADLLDKPKPGKVLRNAWAEVRVHSAFRIRVGHFKRPFSRLEMRGFSSIPFIGRGLFNGLVTEDLGWGDRAVGAMLWGKFDPERRGLHQLNWYVSVSNNALSGAPHGVDVHARLVYDPLAWLSIGVNGAYENIEDALADEDTCRSTWTRGPDCRRNVFAAGGDVAFEAGGFYGSIEANLAQDWLYVDRSPWMLGALGYAAYEFPVSKNTRLQPVLFGEYIDANLSYAESEAVRAGGSFNVLWTEHLRIIPQIEFVQPLPPVTSFNRFVAGQTYALWVAVQL
jgi:hypothetical protein